LVTGGVYWELHPAAMASPWALGLHSYLLLLGVCVVLGGTAGRVKTGERLLYWEAALRLAGAWFFGMSPPLSAAWFALALVGGAVRERSSQVLILDTTGLAVGIALSYRPWTGRQTRSPPGNSLPPGLPMDCPLPSSPRPLVSTPTTCATGGEDRHLLSITREAATKLTEANVKLQD